MSKNGLSIPGDFPNLLNQIKGRIQQAQTRAILSANAELVRLYWDIGRLIDQRQRTEGWGAGVIPRLARELRNELPEVKGFSERNIGRMITFFREYPAPEEFLPQPAAKLPVVKRRTPSTSKLGPPEKLPQAAAELPASLLWALPWFHHVLLIEKIKELDHRVWYMRQTLASSPLKKSLG